MGILINHAHGTKVTGVIGHAIPVTTVQTEKNISEILPPGCWSGQKIMILGGGPSMRGLRFDQMPIGLKIGVNKAFVDYPVNVNYSMDKRFFDELTYPQKNDPKNADLRQKWATFSGVKVFLRVDRRDTFGPSVFLVENVPQKVISYDLVMGIYGGTNSGFGAMMLAIALGCTTIGLLGYDMKVDVEHKRTHWHDGYYHQRVRTIDDELTSMQMKLNSFREEFEEFAGAIRNCGVQVYNLNRDSALDCFPKVNVDEFAKL